MKIPTLQIPSLFIVIPSIAPIESVIFQSKLMNGAYYSISFFLGRCPRLIYVAPSGLKTSVNKVLYIAYCNVNVKFITSLVQ